MISIKKLLLHNANFLSNFIQKFTQPSSVLLASSLDHLCSSLLQKTKQNKTKQSTKISKSFHWPFFPIQQRKNPSTVLSYPAMQDSLRSHARGKLLLVAGSANARAASSGV
jgi:hypothetical protein